MTFVVTTSLRLTAAELAAMRLIAQQRGHSRSRVFRDLIHKEVKSAGGPELWARAVELAQQEQTAKG